MDKHEVSQYLSATMDELIEQLQALSPNQQRTEQELIIKERFGRFEQSTLFDIVFGFSGWAAASSNMEEIVKVLNSQPSKEDLLQLLINTFRMAVAPTFPALKD